MDRNTIIGMVLIMAILGGFMYINTPTQEQRERQKFVADSTREAKMMAAIEDSVRAATAAFVTTPQDSVVKDSAFVSAKMNDLYGPFAVSATGSDELIRIENDVMVLYISPKGGVVKQIELKEYKNFKTKDPVKLFDEKQSFFRLPMQVGSRQLVSDSLYFSTDVVSTSVTGENTLTVPMRLYASPAKDRYIEFVYTIKGDDFMVGYDIRFVNMQGVTAPGAPLRVEWTQVAPSQEKDPNNERGRSTIYYRKDNGKVKSLGTGSNDDDRTESPINWLGFSQQFFTATLISDKSIQSPVDLKTAQIEDSAYVRSFSAAFQLPSSGSGNETVNLKWYFGPKDYKIMKKYDLDLEEQINLGWWIFRYINTAVTINLFQWLDGFNLSYGIIILILTVIVKLALSPITYKTYLSSAKMRVLKPDIDAINEKNKDADPIKKQQETMTLYRKAGVNPLAGCIPALLQMPILFALFQFFPSSIELRGQAFLWADDLSSWDSIYSWTTHIPILSSVYGNHISLFTILMTITTLIYTMTNQVNMGTGAQAQQMKIMMYAMPIVFLGVLNGYSSALSYYYFLANTINIAQTWIMRKFVVDEKKLHAVIDENKKRPDSPKKGWQAKLEEMQKVQQQRAAELNKKKK